MSIAFKGPLDLGQDLRALCSPYCARAEDEKCEALHLVRRDENVVRAPQDEKGIQCNPRLFLAGGGGDCRP